MKMAKAIIGAVTGGLTALFTALSDNGVTAQEWVGVAIATIGVLGVVYGVPNSSTTPVHPVPEPE